MDNPPGDDLIGIAQRILEVFGSTCGDTRQIALGSGDLESYLHRQPLNLSGGPIGRSAMDSDYITDLALYGNSENPVSCAAVLEAAVDIYNSEPISLGDILLATSVPCDKLEIGSSNICDLNCGFIPINDDKQYIDDMEKALTASMESSCFKPGSSNNHKAAIPDDKLVIILDDDDEDDDRAVEDNSKHNKVPFAGLQPKPLPAEPTFNSSALTLGIIELLRQVLFAEEGISEFRLCSPVPHVTQSGLEGSKWTCGYRNLQMLTYALSLHRSEYRAVLFNGDGDVPDVFGIQSWIERAWDDGFDRTGRNQLGGSLLGTDTWIGTCECAALLRYFGIRASVLEFVQPSNKQNGNQRSTSNAVSDATSTAAAVAASGEPGTRSSSRRPRKPTRYYESSCYVSSEFVGEELDSDGWEVWTNRLDEEDSALAAALAASSNDNDLHHATYNVPNAIEYYFEDSSPALATTNVKAEIVANGRGSNSSNNNSNAMTSANSSSGSNINEMEEGSDSDEDFVVEEKKLKQARKASASSVASASAPFAAASVAAAAVAGTAVANGSTTMKRKRRKTYFSSSKSAAYENSNGNKWSAVDTTIDPLAERVGNWIVRYFNRPSGSSTFVPPIYFQHDGHSRTIVGYEKTVMGKINLLIFDPLTNGKVLLKSLQDYAAGNLYANSWKKSVKRGLHTIKRSAYEMLIIEPGLMSSAERMRSKVLEGFPEDEKVKIFPN